MSTRETQALLVEIARKQRELEERERMPSWWQPWQAPARERLVTALVVAVLIGTIAAVLGVIGGSIGGCLEKERTPSALRATLATAPAIPWRHFTGTHDGDRCHVWVSELGMAEILCGGKVIYRGFGLDDDGRFQALPLYQPERPRYDHDVERAAEIDLAHAHVGAFHSYGRGELTIESLREVHP